jgi:hypothetical protein
MDREILRRVFSKEASDRGKNADGIGLKNVNQRLGQVYGPRYRLRIGSTSQEGTSVRMKIPVSGPVLENAGVLSRRPFRKAGIMTKRMEKEVRQ